MIYLSTAVHFYLNTYSNTVQLSMIYLNTFISSTLLSQHVLGIPTVQYCSHVHVLRASWSVQLYYSCRSSYKYELHTFGKLHTFGM